MSTTPPTEAPPALPQEVAAVLSDPTDEGSRLRFAAWLQRQGRVDDARVAADLPEFAFRLAVCECVGETVAALDEVQDTALRILSADDVGIVAELADRIYEAASRAVQSQVPIFKALSGRQ